MSNSNVTIVQSDRTSNLWAGGVHVACLILALTTSFFVGVAGMLPALVVWLLQSDRQSFVARHAAEAFNFNFTLFLFMLVAVIGTVLTLGFGLLVFVPLGLILVVAWLVLCSVLAAIAGFDGRPYRYPFTIRVLGN